MLPRLVVCTGCRRLLGPTLDTQRLLSTVSTGRRVVNVTKLQHPHQGVTVFSINRPEVRNAINFDVLHQLGEAIHEADQDQDTRVVIVRGGSPRMFCAGADLKERHGLPDDDYRRWSWTIRCMTSQLADLRHPTMAAIDGAAIGGGLELALACDIRVAASNVRMGLPETTLAIIPGAGGSQRLPRIVGASFAKELMFTGRILDANLAKDRYNLVNFVVDQNSDGTAAYQHALSLAVNYIKRLETNSVTEGHSLNLQ